MYRFGVVLVFGCFVGYCCSFLGVWVKMYVVGELYQMYVILVSQELLLKINKLVIYNVGCCLLKLFILFIMFFFKKEEVGWKI